MRKQAKKFLTLLTLFFIVLFSISCNNDDTENKGIEQYAGEWFASEIVRGEEITDKYTIDENTKPSLIINLDGSITINSNGEVIDDIARYDNTTYSYIDNELIFRKLEFESDVRCLQITSDYKGDLLYTTTNVLIKMTRNK